MFDPAKNTLLVVLCSHLRWHRLPLRRSGHGAPAAGAEEVRRLRAVAAGARPPLLQVRQAAPQAAGTPGAVAESGGCSLMGVAAGWGIFDPLRGGGVGFWGALPKSAKFGRILQILQEISKKKYNGSFVNHSRNIRPRFHFRFVHQNCRKLPKVAEVGESAKRFKNCGHQISPLPN